MLPALALALTVALASAAEIPAGLQNFYANAKNQGCSKYVSGVSDLQDGQEPETTGYGFCQDKPGAIFLKGNGMWADMDVDCDGAENCPNNTSDFQPGTAFDDTLQSGYGIQHLNALHHPYVVLGTSKAHFEGDNAPLSPFALVAVICNNQLHYGFFGDTNGSDDDNFIGEASYSMIADICFPGQGYDGSHGYTGHDILYVAFTGDDAVVKPEDAPWTGSDPLAFERAIKAKGDRLVAKVFGGGDSGPVSPPISIPTPPSSPGTCNKTPACDFDGHFDQSCSSNDGCCGELTCNGGKCGCAGSPAPTQAPTPPSCNTNPTCDFDGHFGQSCSSNDGCCGELACNGGQCGCASDSHKMFMMERGTPTTFLTKRAIKAAASPLK